jgi:hypothetical protein
MMLWVDGDEAMPGVGPCKALAAQRSSKTYLGIVKTLRPGFANSVGIPLLDLRTPFGSDCPYQVHTSTKGGR